MQHELVATYEQSRKTLQSAGVEVGEFSEIPYGLQFTVARSGIVGTIRYYFGKRGLTEDFSALRLEPLRELVLSLLSPQKNEDALAVAGLKPEAVIGVDESGKGDFFGPLVTAAVCVRRDQIQQLKNWGVADSKTLTPEKIKVCAEKIRKTCVYAVIAVANPRYNTLYQEMGNLNRLLAWTHARAIENVLDKTSCEIALSDQFGNSDVLKKALLEKARKIQFFQRTKAESNLAVAAASIVARDQFVTALDKLSLQYEITLPKGASQAVIDAGKRFVARHGFEVLSNVAKMHFKTAELLR